MRKRFASMLLIMGVGMCFLNGCQQTPQVSENGEIPHAKSNVEQAVEDVVTQGGNTTETMAEQGGFYDKVIGTHENGIWVCAEVPAVAGAVDQITLSPRDDLNETLLNIFLDSPKGSGQDITQQYLEEQEALLNAAAVEVDAGDGIETSKPVETAHFGDDSALMFSDGERTASFFRNTIANYEDESLYQKCLDIYGQAQEQNLTWDRENAEASFSLEQAQKVLMNKLEPLGIMEICLNEIYYYETDNNAFYEFWFTPSYEGIGLAHEFGQTGVSDVIPDGKAWVTEDGVAELHLGEALGKITEQTSKGNILSFSQAADILAAYLESNTLIGCAEAKLTQVEFVYYPNYQEPELVLIPSWHICIPLDQKIESNDPAYERMFEKNAVWNIYLDAVTGELLRVE